MAGQPTASAHTLPASAAGPAGSSGSVLYQIGRYKCDDRLDLLSLLDLLTSYFQKMSSVLEVYTTYLVINIHAASNASHPNQPPPTLSGSQLPSNSERLGSLVDEAVGQYLYTPVMLTTDRSNLNDSWLEVLDENKPITQYFTVEQGIDGTPSTPDGWPCERYLLLAKQRRLLVEIGSVAPEMAGYNFEADSQQLFSPNYTTVIVPVTTLANGTLKTGCFYRPNVTEVSRANSSWAQTSNIPAASNHTTPGELQKLAGFVQNLTACGLSPFVGSALFGMGADESPELYRNVSLLSSWAWAIEEPQDSSSLTDIYLATSHRCAVMDMGLSGHWRAVNCGGLRLAACRMDNTPFSWVLSSQMASFSNASAACPPNSALAVPRTGLENTYLYHYLLAQNNDIIDTQSADAAKRQVWLDFNSIYTESCWVTGGPEAGCPYVANPQQLERRTVLVATIAGIIICLLAALTIFVKCNANRRNSRRTKRTIEGWEYEGVPS